MTCAHCQEHNQEMRRVWRGLSALYRARLAEIRPWITRDPKRRAEYRRLASTVNALVVKLRRPAPDACDWRHA